MMFQLSSPSRNRERVVSFSHEGETIMNNLIYIIGLVVVVLAVLSFLGLG